MEKNWSESKNEEGIRQDSEALFSSWCEIPSLKISLSPSLSELMARGDGPDGALNRRGENGSDWDTIYIRIRFNILHPLFSAFITFRAMKPEGPPKSK
jgi:hypothetical protein